MDLNSLTLGGKTYDSFPDTNARERLTNIEYLTVTTETAQTHSNLPEGNKTVTISGDGKYGDTVYAVGGVDMIPRVTFNRTFPYNGITIEKNGLSYHISGTATANGSTYFGETSNDFNIELDNIAGKGFKLFTFANKSFGNTCSAVVRCYKSDGTQVQIVNKSGNLVNQIASYVANTTLSTVTPFTIPEDVEISYMRVNVDTKANAVYDHDFQIYVVFDNEVQTATLTDGTAELTGITATDVISIPYSSTVDVEAPIKSYIDYKTDNAKGDTVTYLTPEAFGAIGDGYADDIEAITACLAKAVETKQTVLMAKKYLVSAPIDINGDDFNIYINDIVYSGTDTAVKIHGQRNTVKIHSITSSGVGVKFLGDGTKDTLYNDLEINTISASSHGIIFESVTKALYQNNVRFDYIKAGGDGCYGIAYFIMGEKYITENNFFGGHITNCEWAIYNAKGGSRYINIHIEGSVKGGFYITGYCCIENPRWAEAWRDGAYPFLKFACGVEAGDGIKIENNVPISINEIDLSENSDVFVAVGTEYPMPESRLATLNCPIHSPSLGVGLDAQSAINYTHKAYVWGKYLIMTPFMAYRKEVTTATLDTRLIGQGTTETEIRALAQLPTKFVVNTINTDIYLHESYCAFGFNEFEVEQANGFTCKVYDKLNNLIFDGTEQGNGLYKLNVYKDSTYCANSTAGSLRRDFTGHYWSVTKQVTVDDVIAALPIAEGVDF